MKTSHSQIAQETRRVAKKMRWIHPNYSGAHGEEGKETKMERKKKGLRAFVKKRKKIGENLWVIQISSGQEEKMNLHISTSIPSSHKKKKFLLFCLFFFFSFPFHIFVAISLLAGPFRRQSRAFFFPLYTHTCPTTTTSQSFSFLLLLPFLSLSYKRERERERRKQKERNAPFIIGGSSIGRE